MGIFRFLSTVPMTQFLNYELTRESKNIKKVKIRIL